MNVIQIVHRALLDTVISLFATQPEILKQTSLTLNTDPQRQAFGDLSFNGALILAKALQKSPVHVAQELQKAFNHQFVESATIDGPGFLNIVLTKNAFIELAQQLTKQNASFFSLDVGTPKKHHSIEFVSANPTGPLHIGHGRGGIIGDVLARVLTFLGHPVTKEFYINDAGNQMQKLGHSFKIRCQQVLGINEQLSEDAYHGEYLVELAKECIAQYGEAVLSKPDEFFIAYAKDRLLQRIKDTLAHYGITFDVWFSEKTLHESGAIVKVLEQLTKSGYLYEKDGALWFKSTEFGDDKDRVVRKNTGELTYVAADIAYAENKISRGLDQLVMVLGQDHHSYVIRLKAVMQALGYDPKRLDVILYQLVTIKESGQLLRLSKRAGRIVTLEDVIETVGKDVARFFYLHKKADAHLEFDIDLALKHTDENPVYYLQYAYVRTKSILAKANEIPELQNINANDARFLADEERLLLKKITALKEVLEAIGRNYQTHTLTYYALELAQAFHHYYSHHKVIDIEHTERSRARLLMVDLVRSTFKTIFDLLGVSAPEKM